MPEISKIYTIKSGLVFGISKDGSTGAYPISKEALSLTATNAKELKNKVLEMMNTSSIDPRNSEFNFNEELGFLIKVEEVETTTQKGFEYKRPANKLKKMYGGDLTCSQKKFLLELMSY